MCDIKMPKSHFTNFTKVAKTYVCVWGGDPLHRVASLVTRISSRDHRKREHQPGKRS